MEYDYLIVGAGFYGCVMAERIANDMDASVLIIDKRSHMGGNCYSEIDENTGIEFHKYGTHILHTSFDDVWVYLSKFTELNGYFHQVLSTHKGKVYQMPINLETINSFYNLNMMPAEAKEFLAEQIEKENILNPMNFEEKAISLIGRPLYEAFIKGYTLKQWEQDPKNLPSEIINRLPVRYNYDESYFNNSRWQGLPIDGYTNIFKRMLENSKISLELDCDFFEHRNDFHINKKIIYTGPIDQYFDYKYGELEWRSVEFEKKVINSEDFQGTSVMNFADEEIKYTRIHEPKHLHPERVYKKDKTVIFYEKSKQCSKEPFYPIKTSSNQIILEKYKKLAKRQGSIIGGRLGDYAYYDIDKTILTALECYEQKIKDIL